ncbi:deoxyribodipyrimidine photo-lyase [Pseudomonas oligotrophica]|uniref:deoxyribodipyrimidine photo-lyase n=1 Tax=Pseudomonas oligotrophica TaxID=2912055 RepID=UPI001F2D0D3A|nr:deoxyribodipyrimidine photo-lyase [Pseudomonas oligotrophica]MCF7202582.1 deoxyribodipyrimidine photo-lyase [Pseudomonas oligotrophica]
MNQLIWLRSDLRVNDNTALAAAMEAGPTVALFVLTPQQWQAHDDAPCKVDFWLRNLAELSRALGELNVPLLIRQAADWQAVPALMATLCRELRIDCVRVNDEYGVNETRRDAAVAARLQGIGVAWRHHLDQLLFAPGTLLSQSGGYFKVFSQFRKTALARLAPALPPCVPRPAAQAPLAIAADPVPSTVEPFAPPAETLRALWPAGEAHALARLDRFADERLRDYDRLRDLPAEAGTSQLSPYLAAGVVSVRQCLHAVLSHNHGELDSGNPGAVVWLNELLWREFYKHILVGFPHVGMGRAFRRDTEALPWRHAPDELAAWQQGRTGYPLVDAAMRQLLATGWMHNRLRMVCAMFLSKNLLIDWREGERWFMRHLIDGDLAANNGGWQWSASTGTDAVPYFRLFNPVSQSRRFDPDGRFLRRWLPELAALDNRQIHEPASAGGLFAPACYPRPLLDLGMSRARVLEAFRNLEAIA